jgi:peptidoglycan/xylan/chitin deacetylase (PgdA/CDA1 family)
MPSYRQQLETLERWRRFPGMERVEPGRGRFALTFDDGPDAESTPAILDALDAAGAKATFFMTGEQVWDHRPLAREASRRGHVVGLHGSRHVEHDELADPRRDFAEGMLALRSEGHLQPTLYRPPYGRFSAASYAVCTELQLTPVYWSGWGCDGEPIPAERIADIAIRDLAPGAILVLHDSARYAYRDSARPTAEALPAILAAASERGLAPVTL